MLTINVDSPKSHKLEKRL